MNCSYSEQFNSGLLRLLKKFQTIQNTGGERLWCGESLSPELLKLREGGDHHSAQSVLKALKHLLMGIGVGGALM